MKNEEAVSPVIGVILMVAITVILAAVIAAFVFGMAGTTATTKTVGATLSLNKTDPSTDIALQFTGGADLPALSYFTVSYDGGVVTFGGAGEAQTIEGTTKVYVAADGSGALTHVAPTATAAKFDVGEIVFLHVNKPITGHKITIIGGFNDGSNQILLDRTL
jgi:flagellin-like protein